MWYTRCLLSVVYTLQTVPCMLLHTLPMPLTVYCIASLYIMLMNACLVLLSSCNHALVHTDVELHMSSGCGFISWWFIPTPAHLHVFIGRLCQLLLEPRLVGIVTASGARHTGGTKVVPQTVRVEVASYPAIRARISRVAIVVTSKEGW